MGGVGENPSQTMRQAAKVLLRGTRDNMSRMQPAQPEMDVS